MRLMECPDWVGEKLTDTSVVPAEQCRTVACNDTFGKQKRGENVLPFRMTRDGCDGLNYFLPAAFLDALSGLILSSSVLISTFTWVAKLQIPDVHFLLGAG